ncbi:Rsd/AlgQ family anti-sigma factor [Aliiglaciecola litoralis]|uniref:Rsd/AlgQ family anti-sigma factor n=1 Tax=Aliiglaciecola litoralis TaxID=582857 RepID=A0ABN1LSM9_9ALTE
MLNQLEANKQQWIGLHKSIDTWLQERQKLLVQYCQLAGLAAAERQDKRLPESNAISDFCETLVDYVSTGHFEVYDRLMAESNSQAEQSRLEDELYPKISASTEDALAFNDCYAEISNESELSEFDVQLSRLGQKLEERFELEDQLISAYAKQL